MHYDKLTLRGKDPIIDGLIFGVEIVLVLYVIYVRHSCSRESEKLVLQGAASLFISWSFCFGLRFVARHAFAGALVA